MNLDDDIQYLKGVGPQYAKKLNKLGIFSVGELLYYFPRTYEDRRQIKTITQVPIHLDEKIMIRGKIVKVRSQRPGRRFSIIKAILRDQTGHETEAVWFNQQFMKNVLKTGVEVFVSGKVVDDRYSGQLAVYVDDYEVLDQKNIDRVLNCVMPMYSLTEGVYQKKLRSLTTFILENYYDKLGDHLSADFLRNNGLIPLNGAIKEMHYPSGREEWKKAHDRIVFDEFFFQQLGMALRYHNIKEEQPGISFKIEGELINKYKEALPYELTAAQKRVIGEVLADMQKNKPMNRLIQGDVGSGKTDIAIAAILVAVQSGYQAAIMAPTEILATQHYHKLTERLEKLGVKVCSLLGKHTKKEKEEICQKIKEHTVDVVIGTHALIQEGVEFYKLGLAIIDEQHRFGVVQRQALKGKADPLANKKKDNAGESSSQTVEKLTLDLLVMTATPIPRTLALTCYGDLDRSIIDEMPPGRIPIKTSLYKASEIKKVYEFCHKELEQRRQIYVVYPLVEESEKIDLKAAVESKELLQEKIFPEHKVGLLHGKMKNKEKEEIMQQFRENKIQILVSTTVIEVGVDVPNATIMIIEHAARFGLAQLHQLRGRVGRGGDQAYCFLISNPKTLEAKERLGAMVQTTDGFKLAEVDLKLRGPGDQLGVRQSGLPDLNMADLVKDEKILLKARDVAYKLVAEDKTLLKEENYLIKRELRVRNRGFVDFVKLD